MYWVARRRSKKCICNEAIYLDIETSNNHADDVSSLKTWVVSIQVRFNGEYYLFRKPTELMAFFNLLIKEFNLNPLRRMLVIIHNASYDLSYLVPWMQKYLPKEPRSGIYEGLHKIIMYSQYCFDFYCSYMLTGMSLAKWSKELNVEHQKQIGLYDYDKIIYQDDDLDEDSQLYDLYDVLSLEECYKKQLAKYGDDTSTVPMTKTGYCRREFRNRARTDPYYRRKYFRNNMLDVHTYKFALWSFAGGYVHNNKNYKSRIQYGLIGHNDFRSMYPSIMRCYPMPLGVPEVYYDIKHKIYQKEPHHPDDIIKMYPEYFSLVHVRLYGKTKRTKGCELRDPGNPMPFMQESKMFNRSKETDSIGKFNCLSDNGRVMRILSGAAEMVIDNLTLQIYREQYHLDMVVLEVIRFKTEMLPECLSATIDKLFKAKSDKKIFHHEMVEKYGQLSPEAFDAAFELSSVKALLNSTYGMAATKCARTEYDLDYEKYYNDDTMDSPLYQTEGCNTDEEIETRLKDFYDSPNSFLSYMIGIGTTATARFELYEYMSRAIGYKNIIYCDTDSAFYFKTPEITKRINDLNKEKQKNAAYIKDVNGKKIYYDVFEAETDIKAFKGLHSKCYGYVTQHDELVLTIAGIPARTLIGMKDGRPVYLTREEELAGITVKQKLKHPDKNLIRDPVKVLEKLSDSFIFHVNTGTTSVYKIEEPHEEMIDGHLTEIAGGCVIQKLNEKKIKDIDILDFEPEYHENEEGIII